MRPEIDIVGVPAHGADFGALRGSKVGLPLQDEEVR